jgi:homoisocitrate dehydrogenase
LFGAVSSPARKIEGYRSAIITMRQALNLYANIRPVWSLPQVSPRPDVDMIIVRENTEGLYAGREHMQGDAAIAERVITPQASYRIATKALDLAISLGRRRLTIVHKANVLPLTDGLFRDTVRKAVADSGLSIEVDELLVDVAALKIVSHPEAFDLIVTTNLFGDILSDEASHWMGGLGFAPSLNFGDGVALAEPVHGSAPDIAGKKIANPMAAILSAALLVRHAWLMPEKAAAIEHAVASALKEGAGVPNPQTGRFSSTESILQAVLNQLQ